MDRHSKERRDTAPASRRSRVHPSRFGKETPGEERMVERQINRNRRDDDRGDDEEEEPKRVGKLRPASLDDLDQRTLAARRARDLVAGLESDLGGSENLSTGQREICMRVAMCGVMAADLETRFLQGTDIDINAYSTLVSAQRRLATSIGLSRIAKPINGVTAQLVEAIKAGRADD